MYWALSSGPVEKPIKNLRITQLYAVAHCSQSHLMRTQRYFSSTFNVTFGANLQSFHEKLGRNFSKNLCFRKFRKFGPEIQESRWEKDPPQWKSIEFTYWIKESVPCYSFIVVWSLFLYSHLVSNQNYKSLKL